MLQAQAQLVIGVNLTMANVVEQRDVIDGLEFGHELLGKVAWPGDVLQAEQPVPRPATQRPGQQADHALIAMPYRGDRF